MSNLKRRDLVPWFIDTKKLNIIDGKKYCSICDCWLELKFFKVNKAKYLGYNYWCENCIEKNKNH